MELDKKQIEKYLEFMEDTKMLVGLNMYSIKLDEEIITEQGVLARVTPDVYEKDLVVILSEKFLSMDWNKQSNILLHELTHSRIEIFNWERDEQIKGIIGYLEEQLVNDLTRGYDVLIK